MLKTLLRRSAQRVVAGVKVAGRGRHPGAVREVLHARYRAIRSSASSAAAAASPCTAAIATRLSISIPTRRVDVAWDGEARRSTPVAIQVLCADKPGLLAHISKSFTEQGVNISQAHCRTTEDGRAVNTFQVTVGTSTSSRLSSGAWVREGSSATRL